MCNQSLSSTNRRRFLKSAGMSATAALLAPRVLHASFDGLIVGMKRDAKTAKIRTIPLRRNISVLDGSGGNIAVLTGPDGKLMVDAGIAESHSQIYSALAGIDVRPIKQLINTHWHFDHAGGNPWLHHNGASIRAHVNTRKHLLVPTRVEPWKYTFDPIPDGGIPTIVQTGDETIAMNGATIKITHVENAHTDGDLVVAFVEADVIHAGDTFWNGHFPFIDNGTGGSIDGMVRATEANLLAATDDTIIIPGHGPVGRKAELIAYHEMLTAIRARVSDHKKQGHTLAETIAAKPTAEFDQKWGDYAVAPGDFVALVYEGV